MQFLFGRNFSKFVGIFYLVRSSSGFIAAHFRRSGPDLDPVQSWQDPPTLLLPTRNFFPTSVRYLYTDMNPASLLASFSIIFRLLLIYIFLLSVLFFTFSLNPPPLLAPFFIYIQYIFCRQRHQNTAICLQCESIFPLATASYLPHPVGRYMWYILVFNSSFSHLSKAFIVTCYPSTWV